MWLSEPFAFVISLFYFVAVLMLAELLHQRFRLSTFMVRRLIILGLTHSVLVLPALFQNWFWFMLAPAVFCGLYLLASGLRGSPLKVRAGVFGVIYIFLAIIILYYLFWEEAYQPFAAAGVLALAWGDTLAALIGKRMGRHKYYISDEEKSWEGTLGMYAGAWGAIAYIASTQLGLAGHQLMAYVTLTAGMATLIEAVSIRRTDNLFVPLVTALLFYFLVQTNIPSAQISLLVTGIVGSFLVALVAYWLRALDEGGVSGAVLVGTFIFTFGGWNWVPPLLVFFISATLLTRWSRRRSPELFQENWEERGRGLNQVLANGGVGIILSILTFLNILEPHLVFVGFLGALAGTAADTWSTEIGVSLGGRPHLLFSRKLVAPGTSGGVTSAGLWGAFAGSLVITLVGLILFISGGLNWFIVFSSTLAILVAGFFGSLLDSALGVWVQVKRYCDYCLKDTEKPIHYCGYQTRIVRGLPMVNNNVVNFFCSLASAAVAMGILKLFS